MIQARLAEAIRSIISDAEGMMRVRDAHPRYTDYSRDIAGAARHLLGLVANASATSNESGHQVNIAELAESARAMVVLRAAEKRLAFPPLDTTPQYVHGDPGRILQILVNLVGNAVKFTPEGGRIRIRCRRTHGLVHCEVIDSGPGVPGDAHELIFHAFERTAQSDGVGLGLAISRDLARQMQGDLTIMPSRNGAVFRLTLPAA